MTESSIRRGTQLPRSHDWAEYGLEKAAKKEVVIPELGRLKCVLRRGRWHKEEGVPNRTTVCRLVDGKQIVALMEFREYNLEGLDPDAAIDVMDAISDTALHCAELLSTAFDYWDFLELVDQGHLLEFASAWRHPSYPAAAVWADVATYLIETYFRPSVALLKAFPLEYENYKGAVSFDKDAPPHPADRALERRVAAMVRMYSRRLGFALAPAPFGEDGWMMKVRAEL